MSLQGFIKFGNMKKYYVTITGNTLSYYQSFEVSSSLYYIYLYLIIGTEEKGGVLKDSPTVGLMMRKGLIAHSELISE